MSLTLEVALAVLINSLSHAADIARHMYDSNPAEDRMPMIALFAADMSGVEGIIGLTDNMQFADAVDQNALQPILDEVDIDIIVSCSEGWTYPESVLKAIWEGAGGDETKMKAGLALLYETVAPSQHPDRVEMTFIVGGRRSTNELYMGSGPRGKEAAYQSTTKADHIMGRQPDAMRKLLGIT